jgi:hypothetical protein
MKLNDLDKPNTAKKALKENFNIELNTARLNRAATRKLLNKVRSLIAETKNSKAFYRNQNNEAYLKMIFMEQALSDHYRSLMSNTPVTKIVVENVEVEKSQVILAAQDMVDSMQKMIEDVNDMLVKELPALYGSIQNEIGVNEGDAFNQSANQALANANQALMQSKTELQAALNALTGQQGGQEFPGAQPAPEEEAGAEMDMALPGGEEEVAAGEEELPAPEEQEESEEEQQPIQANVGRARR